MTEQTEALKMALAALEYHTVQTRPIAATEAAITAIEEALAQPEQERNFCHRCGKRLMSALGPVSLHTCCPPNGRTFDDYGNKIL